MILLLQGRWNFSAYVILAFVVPGKFSKNKNYCNYTIHILINVQTIILIISPTFLIESNESILKLGHTYFILIPIGKKNNRDSFTSDNDARTRKPTKFTDPQLFDLIE
jgi:hypothetical protein